LRSIFIFAVAVLVTLMSFCVAFADEVEGESSKLEFSGVLEGELGYTIGQEEDESDLALATVELGADMSLASNVCGHVLFLYEQGENDDNIAVDEGTIDLKLPITLPVELSLSLGRMYVPFGEFNSHFVTDPFTLEIGETNQVALQLSASHDIMEGSVALYNEEVDDSSQIGDIAAKVATSVPEGALGKDIGLSFGASLVTNVAGTDGLTDMIGGGAVPDRAMGLGGYVSLNAMGAFLEGEIVMALGDIEIPGGETLKPRAFNMELGYSLPNMPVEIAGKFEQFSENGDNSTNRFGGVVTIGLFDEAAFFGLEFLRSDDSETVENSIIGQLSVEF